MSEAGKLGIRLKGLPFEVRQYLLITGNYWAFTLTDGALRMLVVLYFHQLGYSPLEVALLFLFYEAFGVVTNLVGGWLGARLGLNRTMNVGLGLQIVALVMLMVPAAALTVPWVMAAQALSGIAKDLNKMSAKSAVKVLVPKDSPSAGCPLPLGSDPHRFQERAEGGRFLPRRPAADSDRLPRCGHRHGIDARRGVDAVADKAQG